MEIDVNDLIMALEQRLAAAAKDAAMGQAVCAKLTRENGEMKKELEALKEKAAE